MVRQLAAWVPGRVGALLALALPFASGPASASPVSDFYKGKTIDLVIGLPAGGGYDAYGRLVARRIGAHIPGDPTVVPQNMPGGGGLTAANYLYNSAPKDGSAFGLVATSALIEPLFKEKEALFDAAKFSWLGSASQDVSYCGIGPRSHIASFDQWLKSGKQLTFGASGPAAITYQHPMVLKNVLGANLRVISGYRGTSDITLALERGEVDGICGMFVSSIESKYKSLLDSGKMKLIIQMGSHKDKTFGHIPSVFDYAKTKEQRKILSISFDQLALGRPFIAPPGVPDDRYQALSKAFAETLKDPKLLADAKKMHLDVDYLSGAEAKKLLKQFADYPPALLQKAKSATGQR
ncbi:MAG TPA: tripartite tricarboxylate transporter substrate-binding protein [Beijerinckiaceae bacterium]|nr:tripartite tricarboxylate transporter substrate-binding protein [Beijerinckiaceae bacterium]